MSASPAAPLARILTLGAVSMLASGTALAEVALGGALCVAALQRSIGAVVPRGWTLLTDAQSQSASNEATRNAERYLFQGDKLTSTLLTSLIGKQCMETTPLATLPQIIKREDFPQTDVDHLHACIGTLAEWKAVTGRSYDAGLERRLQALDALFSDAKIIPSMPQQHWAKEALTRISLTGSEESVRYCARYYKLLLKPPAIPNS